MKYIVHIVTKVPVYPITSRYVLDDIQLCEREGQTIDLPQLIRILFTCCTAPPKMVREAVHPIQQISISFDLCLSVQLFDNAFGHVPYIKLMIDCCIFGVHDLVHLDEKRQIRNR